MKTIKKLTTIILSVITVSLFLAFGSGCTDNNTVLPPIDTNQHFSYSLNNGTLKEIQLTNVKARYAKIPNASGFIEEFQIELSPSGNLGGLAQLQNLTGLFSFPNINDFLNGDANNSVNPNHEVLYGVQGNNASIGEHPIGSTTFIFLDYTSPQLLIDFINNNITVVINEYPYNVGEYISFTFSGSYTDINNVSGNITGSARLKRTADY